MVVIYSVIQWYDCWSDHRVRSFVPLLLTHKSAMQDATNKAAVLRQCGEHTLSWEAKLLVPYISTQMMAPSGQQPHASNGHGHVVNPAPMIIVQLPVAANLQQLLSTLPSTNSTAQLRPQSSSGTSGELPSLTCAIGAACQPDGANHRVRVISNRHGWRKKTVSREDAACMHPHMPFPVACYN